MSGADSSSSVRDGEAVAILPGEASTSLFQMRVGQVERKQGILSGHVPRRAQ